MKKEALYRFAKVHTAADDFVYDMNQLPKWKRALISLLWGKWIERDFSMLERTVRNWKNNA